jgi:hypothetical protein
MTKIEYDKMNKKPEKPDITNQFPTLAIPKYCFLDLTPGDTKVVPIPNPGKFTYGETIARFCRNTYFVNPDSPRYTYWIIGFKKRIIEPLDKFYNWRKPNNEPGGIVGPSEPIRPEPDRPPLINIDDLPDIFGTPEKASNPYPREKSISASPKKKTIDRRSEYSSIIDNTNNTNRPIISMTNIRDGDIMEWLRWTYYTNPKSFTKKFKGQGITVEGVEDLEHLETAYKKGAKNILDICQSIEMDKNDLINNIKIIK